jgi:7-cyano-7-deazaguanine synthase
MSTTKAVMPFSGGMDSSVMLRMVQFHHDEIHLITFDYGQRHIREIECAKRQIEQAKLIAFSRGRFSESIIHKIIDVSFIKDIAPTSSLTNLNIDNPDVKDMVGEAQPVSYVPFRNQLFLSIACAYAEGIGANTVYHGATKVDSLAGYWDGSPEFLDALNQLVALNRKNQINVVCPLLAYDKRDIVLQGIKSHVDFANTYTCYSGDEIASVTTPSSSLRIKGFAEAGYIDPQPYKENLKDFWEKHNCKPCPTNPLYTKEGTRGAY